jgi:exodeoxyribonuclease VII small subunit
LSLNLLFCLYFDDHLFLIAMATKSLLPETGAKAAKAPKTATPVNYEAALQELEQLAAQLESGQLPLDQLMAGYKRGAELLKFCRSKLEAIEQQISVIDGDQLKPWVQE